MLPGIFGDVVDWVRRQEHKMLIAKGYEDLKGSKYDWLYNPKNMTHEQKNRFKTLHDSTLKTARAWAIKELAMSLWHYVSKIWVMGTVVIMGRAQPPCSTKKGG